LLSLKALAFQYFASLLWRQSKVANYDGDISVLVKKAAQPLRLAIKPLQVVDDPAHLVSSSFQLSVSRSNFTPGVPSFFRKRTICDPMAGYLYRAVLSGSVTPGR